MKKEDLLTIETSESASGPEHAPDSERTLPGRYIFDANLGRFRAELVQDD